jgi:hypothetical protein
MNTNAINEQEQEIITSLVNNEYRTKYLKENILRLQEFLEFIAKTLKSKKRQEVDSKDEEMIKINEELIHILYKHHSDSLEWSDHDIKHESITKIFNKFNFCQKLLKKIIRSIYGAVINQKILDAQSKIALYRCYYAVTSKKLEDFLENSYINAICREASRRNFDIAFKLFYTAVYSSGLDEKIKIYNDVFNMMENREDLLTTETKYKLHSFLEWKDIIDYKKNGFTTEELYKKYNHYSTERIDKIIKLYYKKQKKK